MISYQQNFENFCKIAHKEMHRAGVRIDCETLKKIIGNKMDHEISGDDPIIYDSNSYGLDTLPREDVYDIVADHYMGQRWPTYSDKVDINAFLEKMQLKIDGENK